MIFDSAKNLDFYRGLGIEGRYDKAVDFLQNTDLENLAPGKYEIDGRNVYANVTEPRFRGKRRSTNHTMITRTSST